MVFKEEMKNIHGTSLKEHCNFRRKTINENSWNKVFNKSFKNANGTQDINRKKKLIGKVEKEQLNVNSREMNNSWTGNVKYVHRLKYKAAKQNTEKSTDEPNEYSCKCTHFECAGGTANIPEESYPKMKVNEEQICGPERCDMEQLETPESVAKQKEIFSKLEEYNCTSLPFPVKNKYLEILKVYGFPFEEIGPFEECKKKKRGKKSLKFKGPLNLVSDALDEANELFTKAGYEDELVKWLARVYKAVPKPEDPHQYLKTSVTSEGIKNNNEYFQHLEELKNILAFENELAFELAQIKLLCGMIDEENFGYDGKPREEWNGQVDKIKEKKIKATMKCYLMLYNNINREIRDEKKRLREEGAANLKTKRDQIIQDLQMWKNFKPPTMDTTFRCIHDGRQKDWFEGLYVPDPEGKGQAPVKEFDDDEAFRKPFHEEIIRSRSSSILFEEYN